MSHDGVHVGVGLEEVAGRLHDRHHAGAEAVFVGRRLGHQLPDGVPGDLAELAEQLAMVQEVWSQQLGHGECPHGVGHRLEH
ncbi:MAG TPA: hypothetical protein VNB06_15705, partial [Thermoanaerobaculia bacterium]|nr:hypothetical protein [Thermoanaerobaculia bacterium]